MKFYKVLKDNELFSKNLIRYDYTVLEHMKLDPSHFEVEKIDDDYIWTRYEKAGKIETQYKFILMENTDV